MKAINKKQALVHPPRLQELLRYARTHSPFYKNLYSGFPDIVQLKDLPVIPTEAFWEANKMPNSQVLTEKPKNALVMRSGGTTGNPKFSIFSIDEWDYQAKVGGEKFAINHVDDNDVIANLFSVGSMYASFIFAFRMMANCPKNIVQLPIASHTPQEETLQIFKDFNVNTIMGSPITILNLAECYAKLENKFDKHQIKKAFYAGDFFFHDQQNRLKEIFPNIQLFPISYASVDGGLLGYVDKSCSPGEYRTIDNYVHIEIIDEKTGAPIEDLNKEGLIVATNLHRRLMPTIRYPVGDKGMWLENSGAQDRKFKLLGRSEDAARIGGIKFYIPDVRKVLESYQSKLKIIDFQLVTFHDNHKDHIIFKIASYLKPEGLKKYDKEILDSIIRSHPQTEMSEFEEIAPLRIEWVAQEDLQVNPRTGKLARVIDKRK